MLCIFDNRSVDFPVNLDIPSYQVLVVSLDL